MVQKFDQLGCTDRDYGVEVSRRFFPKVLVAGESAGTLTRRRRKDCLTYPASWRQASRFARRKVTRAPVWQQQTAWQYAPETCPPVRPYSAWSYWKKTFQQAVSDAIDLVTTPDRTSGRQWYTANNCTSDLNAWVGLFREFAESFGMEVDMNQLFGTLYNKALEGDKDCGGLLSYGYLSGENITGVDRRPTALCQIA